MSITLPDFDFSTNAGEDYDDEEGYEDGEGDEYDEGEDIDAEAEEMARRLGDQLLADIAKAQAEAAAVSGNASAPPASRTEDVPVHHQHPEAPPQSTYRKKQDAALLTMKAIISFASHNPVVQSAMTTSQVPGIEGANLLDVFNRCISASSISKPLARTLTEIVLSLAKSDVLFGSLRNSDAPALQLDKGKRKRDQADEGGRHAELGPSFPQKRISMSIDQPDLLHLLSDAVRIISHALSSAPAHRPSVEPALISSIQLQLHQVFLFAVTSAPRALDGRMPALQELAGLVQMLGVLSGIHIGHPPMHHPSPSPLSTSTSSTSAYVHAVSTGSASPGLPLPPARPLASLWRLIASRRENILLHPAHLHAFFSWSKAWRLRSWLRTKEAGQCIHRYGRCSSVWKR